MLVVDSRFKKVLVAVGGAALLTASALPVVAQDEGPLLYVINKSADQGYFIDLQNGFEGKVAELGGTSLRADAKLDPSLGVQLVNDAISAGAMGIAITVPDQTIGPAIADAAAAAGVALVATDDAIVDSAGEPVPFVGFDGVDMGKKVGAETARLLAENGWIEDESVTLGVLSTEVQTLSVCEDRTNEGKAAMLEAGVAPESIFQVPYTGEAQSAQDAAGPVITAHPDVTHWVVFGCNDEGVLGVNNALATQGVATDDVLAVGLGANEACKAWAAGVPSGFKSALWVGGTGVGETAATLLYEHVVNGAELPANNVAATPMLTPENYAEIVDAVFLENCSQ
jgi:L-arabinose transport system substrate-binding protein